MKALNFGSMNLDYVYQVDHFVGPGETLSSRSRAVKLGGKGLNQSIALARAGARVSHAVCLGTGGEPLREILRENGVDVSALFPVEEMQGHTVIQVNPDGENCILLYGGSNRCVTEAQIDRVLDQAEAGDWLVLQNEINLLDRIVVSGEERTAKPGPELYRILLDRYGLRADSCVFIDDSPRNAAGAEAVGIRGLVFRDAAQLRRDLDGILSE